MATRRTAYGRAGGASEGGLREKVYKIARVLSIIFVADGIFMAWALARGGYAGLGYGQLSYIPLFIPAFLVGLVISAIYVHGFARRSWTVRQSERLFFLLFFLAVAAKVAVFIQGQRDDARERRMYGVAERVSYSAPFRDEATPLQPKIDDIAWAATSAGTPDALIAPVARPMSANRARGA